MSSNGAVVIVEASSSSSSSSLIAASRCSSAANPPITTAATGQKIEVKRWVCDVCKVKWFIDFREACEHEENCAKAGKSAGNKGGGSSSSSSSPLDPSKSTMVAASRVVQSDLISFLDSNDESARSESDGDDDTVGKGMADDGALAQRRRRQQLQSESNHSRETPETSSPASSSSSSTGITDEKKEGGQLSTTDLSRKLSLRNESPSLTYSRIDSVRKKANAKTKENLKGRETRKTIGGGCGGGGQLASIFFPKTGVRAAPPRGVVDVVLTGKVKSSRKKKKKATTCTKAKKEVFSFVRKEDRSVDNVGVQPVLIPGVSQADYKEHVVAERQHQATATIQQKHQQKQPRRIPKRLVASTEESAADDEEEEAAEKPNKRARPSRKRVERQQRRDKDADDYNDDCSLSSEYAEDDEDVEYVATTGKSAPTNITAEARQKKTFLSKKQLAEHHAAEILARRQREAAEERERQKKREELRHVRRPNKEQELELITKDPGAAPAAAVEVDGRNSIPSLRSSDDVLAMGKRTSDQKRLCGHEEKKDMCIAAVRFPCPSHVMRNNDTEDDESSETTTEVHIRCSASLRHIRRTPRYQHLKPDMVPSTVTDKLCSEHTRGLVADDAHARNRMFDMLSSVFSRIETESKTTAEKEDSKKNEGKQLWVDRFSMTTVPDDLLGTYNKESSKKLISFVEEWKLRRHKSVQRMGRAKKGGKRKKRKHGYDSDDSFLDDGDAGLENIFLITGPTGSGKTRLVHAVAEQSDCVVIELNSSEQRSGAALKRAIQETTQSHSSLAVSKKKQQCISTGRFFASNASGIENNYEDDIEDDDKVSYLESDEESEMESHSLSIILIDEVELIFEEDTGFWLGLAQVAQKAKCPIILTANSSPPELTNFRYQCISLKRPLPQECGIKMAHVAKSTGMCFNYNIDPEKDLDRLSSIAEVCQCDLRKIVNEMHLFHFAESRQHARTARVDMNNFEIQRVMECSTPLGAVDDRPIIVSIEPKIIPKDRHTLITITGKNFSSATFPTQRWKAGSASLFIGDKECSHFRIVSATEIIAVCPPCTIPKGVSEKAIYQDDFSKNIDCLTCKFLEVSVRKKCANGLVLQSDSRLGVGSNDCPASKNWNIEYDIPLRDDAWGEYVSKEDFIRKSKSQKVAQERAAIENDSLMLSFDEEVSEEKTVPHARNFQVQRNEGDDATMESECEMVVVSPQTMLDAAIATIEACDEASELTPPPDVHCKNLVELNQLADELGLLSDAILLEDSLSTLAIPSLSGSVEGFGSDALETSSTEASSIAKLCKGKNKKPPSFEALYLSNLNESSFFFGNTDSYVTNPTMRRDRQLLSYSELHSRGLGFLDNRGCLSEDISDNTKSGMEDEETDSSFLTLRKRVSSEDDILLNPLVFPPYLSLPSLLEQSVYGARNVGLTIDPTQLLRTRSNQTANNALGVMHSAVANCDIWYTGLRHDNSDEAVHTKHVWRRDLILDRPLSLDYLPHLRAIANHERRIRGKVEDVMKENADTTRGGRRTRSNRTNIRRHYLDECAGGQDKTIEGKALELADKYMIIE